ncbi:hypothetical protein BGZ65_004510 [Modicella reniformis]|uniref:Uncharacterized protein n=1 Tax=Modicella reniformis TaxID=1440133 RepID=A0A9P6LYW0_9FUNG|nr:hypothetical protein BGZ65_004510 [Modicella reniformis]
MVSDVFVYKMKTAARTSEYVASPAQRTTASLYVATLSSGPSSGGGGGQDSSSSGLLTGSIAAIVIGAIAVLVAIAIVVVIPNRRFRQNPRLRATIYVSPEYQEAINTQIAEADRIQQQYMEQLQVHIAAGSGE